MRPAEFPSEAIIQAGTALQAAGRNITGFALRQKVGGGNPSRLKLVWDEYVNSQAVTRTEPVAELPVEVAEELAAVTQTLTERLAALAVELNDKAVKAAERRVAERLRAGYGEGYAVVLSATPPPLGTSFPFARAVPLRDDSTGSAKRSAWVLPSGHVSPHPTRDYRPRRSLLPWPTAVVRAAGEQSAQAEGELADAAEALDDLETRLEEARGEAEGLRKQLEAAREDHQAQAVELAQVRERLAAAEQSAKTQAEAHTAELARLNAGIEAERARYQQQAEQWRGDLEAQQAAALTAAGERDQARAELIAVKARAEAADQAHQEHRQTAAREAHRMAERLTQAEADRDEARKAVTGAREEAATLRGQIKALETQTAELMRALAASRES